MWGEYKCRPFLSFVKFGVPFPSALPLHLSLKYSQSLTQNGCRCRCSWKERCQVQASYSPRRVVEEPQTHSSQLLYPPVAYHLLNKWLRWFHDERSPIPSPMEECLQQPPRRNGMCLPPSRFTSAKTYISSVFLTPSKTLARSQPIPLLRTCLTVLVVVDLSSLVLSS